MASSFLRSQSTHTAVGLVHLLEPLESFPSFHLQLRARSFSNAFFFFGLHHFSFPDRRLKTVLWRDMKSAWPNLALIEYL